MHYRGIIIIFILRDCAYKRPSKREKQQVTWPQKLAAILSESTDNRKGGKNWDSNNPFLSSESDICSILHFGCFESQITNSLPLFQTFSVIFSEMFSMADWERLITIISIITSMTIENRVLWLARSFALSHYNHRAVIIALKASSFQNGSQIFWSLAVGNWSIILFSRIIINVIILKQLVASGDVTIRRYSRRLRRLIVNY